MHATQEEALMAAVERGVQGVNGVYRFFDPGMSLVTLRDLPIVRFCIGQCAWTLDGDDFGVLRKPHSCGQSKRGDNEQEAGEHRGDPNAKVRQHGESLFSAGPRGIRELPLSATSLRHRRKQCQIKLA